MRRIAMSGARNISSAMMRSWGNRPDTFVCDEPLYAHYLLNTRAPHPEIDEVIRSQENDWRKVVAWLTEFEPPGKTAFYQKHMAHHLLPAIDSTENWYTAIRRNPGSFLKRSLARSAVPFPLVAELKIHQKLKNGFRPPIRILGSTP